MSLPTLVLAMHGTRSSDGVGTTEQIAAGLRSLRTDVAVELCYLDVLQPSLRAVLPAVARPAVVVPALLSTGYHVEVDIPSVVADVADVTVARHLGPHPLLGMALADRLAEARGERPAAGGVVLVGAGSSNPVAREDLKAAAVDLADLLGRPVKAAALSDSDLDVTFGPDVEVATYLLAEGFFAESLRSRATAAGVPTVAAPLGVHPAVLRLILDRFDEAFAG